MAHQVSHRGIAQLVEQRSPKPRAQGSSPCAPAIFGSVVQLVRTPACHAGGRGFEPHPSRHYASVAQLVEQGTENPRVVGSIPTGGTIFNNQKPKRCHADLAHLVERDLAKVEVAGSSPVIRSILWRHSQAVRQRSATPLSPVRFWVAPPMPL